MIILSPAKSLFRSKSIDRRHFSRAANGGIGLQKLHNYAAQFYQLAKQQMQQVSNK
jgi:hypothetical protein